jgi:hypothetical protein
LAPFSSWGLCSPCPCRRQPAAGRSTIAASHVFKDEGHFSATIAAHDNHGHALIGRETVTVTEADAFTSPVSDPRPATVNKPVTGQIALFSDTGYPANVPRDFRATIDWGDGTTTLGVVTAPSAGTFAVSGAHTYASVKLFSATITLKDDRPGTQIGTTRVPIDVMAGTP